MTWAEQLEINKMHLVGWIFLRSSMKKWWNPFTRNVAIWHGWHSLWECFISKHIHIWSTRHSICFASCWLLLCLRWTFQNLKLMLREVFLILVLDTRQFMYASMAAFCIGRLCQRHSLSSLWYIKVETCRWEEKGSSQDPSILSDNPTFTKDLFSLREIVEHTRWHKEKRVQEANVMRHPADGDAWMYLDENMENLLNMPATWG